MAEQDDNEKTEEATAQRREDFRKRGQVAQSRELGSVFVVFASLMSIWMLGHFFFEQIHQVFTRSFTDFLVSSSREEDWYKAFAFSFTKAALIVAPIALIMWVVNVAATLIQVGFLYNEEALKFDFARLDPVQGMKKIFSLKGLVEGVKAVLKMSLVGVIVYAVLSKEAAHVSMLSQYDVPTLIIYIGKVLLKLFGWVGLFMLALSGLDYFFQRWDLEKKMKMTKQELKEEIKSREGDPLIRARVRRLQREMTQRRMMDDVKKADVIITNPTHIAVAIQYTKEMVAPKVIAKGGDEVAERIKKRAKELNIPIVENKPLARTIFKTIKIGQTIPRELYTAVAEVLSYIFKLKKKSMA